MKWLPIFILFLIAFEFMNIVLASYDFGIVYAVLHNSTCDKKAVTSLCSHISGTAIALLLVPVVIIVCDIMLLCTSCYSGWHSLPKIFSCVFLFGWALFGFLDLYLNADNCFALDNVLAISALVNNLYLIFSIAYVFLLYFMANRMFTQRENYNTLNVQRF